MTTIFGIKCKDGLVVCSDTQATSGKAKERTTKITPIGDNAILGSSGNDLYIQNLEDTFESFSPDAKDYRNSIKDCIRAYSKEVAADMNAAGLRRSVGGEVEELYLTDALLAFSDSNFGLHLFEVIAPYGAKELRKPPFRLSVGSGGTFSDFVLKIVEERVFNVAKLGWEDMMINEVMQFSAHLLFSVGSFEKYTSQEARIWYLNKMDRKPREHIGIDLWGEENPNYLRVFLKTILANHPEEVKKWMKNYVDDDFRQRLFDIFTSGASL